MSPESALDLDEDEAFDCQLPRRLQMKSALHLTPAGVAREAAHLLAPRPGMRILDVGAGPGKFCVLAAREAPGCTFVGVELRPSLIKLARKLAARTALPNVSFVEGNALDLDWSDYDAFYFYNPFGEQLLGKAFQLDRTLALHPARFLDYVRGARERLAAAPIGTRIVTYHGLGAPPPRGYERVNTPVTGAYRLELWIKCRDAVA